MPWVTGHREWCLGSFCDPREECLAFVIWEMGAVFTWLADVGGPPRHGIRAQWVLTGQPLPRLVLSLQPAEGWGGLEPGL